MTVEIIYRIKLKICISFIFQRFQHFRRHGLFSNAFWCFGVFLFINCYFEYLSISFEKQKSKSFPKVWTILVRTIFWDVWGLLVLNGPTWTTTTTRTTTTSSFLHTFLCKSTMFTLVGCISYKMDREYDEVRVWGAV